MFLLLSCRVFFLYIFGVKSAMKLRITSVNSERYYYGDSLNPLQRGGVNVGRNLLADIEFFVRFDVLKIPSCCLLHVNIVFEIADRSRTPWKKAFPWRAFTCIQVY